MHGALRLGTRGRRWRWPRRARSRRRSRPRSAGPTAASRSSPITTTGDKIQDRPLAEIGGKALWTKELDRALLDGEVDFCVHSMKDVESDPAREIHIAAVRPRGDVRDRLDRRRVDRRAEAGRGGRHLVAAARGAAAAASARPQDRADPRQCRDPAREGRGGRGRRDPARRGRPQAARTIDAGTAIPTEIMLPAPGQAVIGIECRTNDTVTQSVLTTRQQPDHLSTA